MTLAERLTLYVQLTRLNRPIGILLLLWPTLWGVWIAGNGHPSWQVVLIFVAGTVLMRSAPPHLKSARYDFCRYVWMHGSRRLPATTVTPLPVSI